MQRTAALVWFGAILAFATLVHAQSPNASATGRVTDSSKAIIIGARVVVSNVSTNLSYEALTNGSGEYYFPNLLPGTYRLEAEKTGFRTVIKPDVILHVQEAVEINFELSPGSKSESITVEGGEPLLQLATSDRDAVVDATTIRQLPLNGRSWTDLATLQPGVTGIETQASYAAAADRGNRGFGSQVSISGGRVRENSYRIDGVSVNDYSNGGPGSVLGGTLGVDAIEEFSVITANAPAEYGRTSAGVISAITRSGTNNIHGSAYEFLRNSALDARNYFDSGTIPPFKRNQFGGAIGGPLWKDHTFLFVDYEGNRQSTGITNKAIVPSIAARSGQLSTGAVTVDPAAQKYLALWPMPNGPVLPGGDTAIYNFVQRQVVDENFATARLDHKLGNKDSLFSTFAYDDTPYTSPDNLGDVLLGDRTTRRTLAVQETHTFSASWLNSARFGLNREGVQNNLSANALNPAAGDTSLGAIPGERAAQVSIGGGITPFKGGYEDATHFNWTSYQVSDDVYFTRGRHSVKFGAVFEDMQSDLTYYSYLTGLFSFGSLERFLTNQPSRFRAALPGLTTPRNMRQKLFGAYARDDFRLLPNLTLNLGLRYEITNVPTEVNGKFSTLESLTSPVNHLGSPLFQNPTLVNLEPRAGLAWDPWGDGRTVVHAGFGMYDVLPLPYEFQNMETRAAPFYLLGSTKPPAGSFYTGAVSLLTDKTLSVTWIDQNPKRDYVMQWNLNIQRELMKNLTATIGYVGAHGVHQPMRIDDANVVQPTLTSAGYLWPSPAGSGTLVNPNYGEIRSMQWDGSSIYHALEVNVTEKMAHGFHIQGSYTWGKSIDTGSSTIVGDEFLTSMSSLSAFDLRLNRGVSDFNMAQNLVIAGTWQVPTPASFSGPLARLAKGWELSTFFKVNSGVPFTATFGTDGDPLGLNSSDPWAYPNRLNTPGCSSLVNPGNPNHYIKTECFSLPTAPSQAFYFSELRSELRFSNLHQPAR